MVTCFILLVVIASAGLARQADVPVEGQSSEKNVGQTSENITGTVPTNFGFAEDHTFIPFRQENGRYSGNVTRTEPSPTPINGTQIPLPDPTPPARVQAEAAGYPIVDGLQVLDGLTGEDIAAPALGNQTSLSDPTSPNRVQPEPAGQPVIDGLQVPLTEALSEQGLAFKWHVGIYSKTFSPYKQICGGTLVSLKAVISAAHCFWSDLEGALSATQFLVATGKRYRPLFDPKDEHTQTSEVSSVHIPPRFRGSSTNFQGDIAVVLLSSTFATTPSVRPACVSLDEEFDKQQLQKGSVGTVLGWGLTEEDGGPSPILNYVELPFVDINECLSTAAEDFLKYITTDKICAGVTTGKALCRGDSGGGWIVNDDSNPPIPYLRGVASTAARNDHQCNAYALAALTHVLSHRPFLTQHIPTLENECRLHYPQIRNDSDKVAVRMGGSNSKLVKYKGKKKFVCNCYCNNKKT